MASFGLCGLPRLIVDDAMALEWPRRELEMQRAFTHGRRELRTRRDEGRTRLSATLEAAFRVSASVAEMNIARSAYLLSASVAVAGPIPTISRTASSSFAPS